MSLESNGNTSYKASTENELKLFTVVCLFTNILRYIREYLFDKDSFFPKEGGGGGVPEPQTANNTY